MMKAEIEAAQDRGDEALERFTSADDWGKTVDYLISLAPEPEPPLPEPPDDWDEDGEDNPHYDTPGGY